MAFWANIRPFYINHWNKTEYVKNLNDTVTPELDYIDILTVANQISVAVFGK